MTLKNWVHKRRLRALLYSGSLLSGMAIGAFLLAYISAGEIYDYQDTVDGTHLPKVDAIVCLAGGRGRIAAAGDLWYRYWESAGPAKVEPPILYISGMGKKSDWKVLTKQVRRGVLEVLQQKDVVLETESSNTEENALWLVKYAQEKGWTRILLVTSRYHMRRAKLIFDQTVDPQLTPQLTIETLSVYQEPFEPDEWRVAFHGIKVTIGEYLKWLYYRAKG